MPMWKSSVSSREQEARLNGCHVRSSDGILRYLKIQHRIIISDLEHDSAYTYTFL